MGDDQHKKLFDVARTLRERKPSDVDNYLARTPSRQQLAFALEQQKLLRACADLDHVGDAISVEVNPPPRLLPCLAVSCPYVLGLQQNGR